MDTSILKYMAFAKTVECGSFTMAAELLSYSQSGISRMIGDLEKQWGVSLLERSRTGIRLTYDGMKLLPYVKSICDEYSKLQMQIDDLNGLRSGLIRIGTISSIATHILPDIIAKFQQSCPGIDYELLLGHYADIESWVAKGRVDCGFLRITTQTKFEHSILVRNKFMAVLPKNHPLADCDKFPVSAFVDYPFMLLEKDEKADISEIFDSYGIKPHIHFKTVDDYAVMSMVEKGLGISILPKLILKRTPYNIAIKELDVPAHRNLGIIMRSKKTASVAVKRFIEYLPTQTIAKP